ncbi:plexin-C1 isoform X2 [Hemicordylus capensis]|uniref:plexin-C1 isoform X2 n=1 Tax=Hemicordylus capensis TaxID=884348 RepID=UPI0023033B73|nr:plexin-C1 isoform X2 [Hemicordylus capensis]
MSTCVFVDSRAPRPTSEGKGKEAAPPRRGGRGEACISQPSGPTAIPCRREKELLWQTERGPPCPQHIHGALVAVRLAEAQPGSSKALGRWSVGLPGAAGWLRRMKEEAGGGRCWLLLALVAAGVVCQQQEFNRSIDNLAVILRRVWVATGNCLYELEPSLEGPLPSPSCQESPGTVNKLLLPFGEGDDRLLTCWTLPNGDCYQHRLRSSNETVEWGHRFGSELVSCWERGSAAGKIYKADSNWYLIVATTTPLHILQPGCVPRTEVMYIKEETKEVAESRLLKVHANNSLYFVDIYQWGRHFFFPYYHTNNSMDPLMVITTQDLKRHHLQGHGYGQTALRCARGTKILSSSWIELSKQRVFWVGIFGSAQAGSTPSSTALCIFDLTQVLSSAQGCTFKDFAELVPSHSPCKNTTQPINGSPSLSRSDLTSVYATVVLGKIVLFLGTEQGQLLKVLLDENMKPDCPNILYEIESETAIFHKLELDPVNKDYIYLPSVKKIRRIPVANCSKFISCNGCLSSMDPHCGWCHLNKRCTLKGDCPYSNNSENWIDISYGTDKCLKIYITDLDRGEISMTAVVNFSGLSKRTSTCKVINTKTNKIICEEGFSDLMNCSCHFKKADLTDKVQVSLISGSWNWSEILEFDDCSFNKMCEECHNAGCIWYARENKCAASTVTCKKKLDCGTVLNASNGKGTMQRPKFMLNASIEPMWISILGKSEVIVTGDNPTVSNILVEITGTSSCKPDVIPVRNRNGTHMKFCLPPSRKEVKNICVKADGFECSPPGLLYYVSLPICSKIFPDISWMSGGRNITISGRNLNIADIVIVSNEQGVHLSNFTCRSDPCNFTTIKSEKGTKIVNIDLEIERKRIACGKLRYGPDPKFIRFELTTDMEPDLELKIYGENDNFKILRSEIEVYLSHMTDEKLRNLTFTVQNITKTETFSIIHCRAKWENNFPTSKFDKSSVKIYVKMGNLDLEVPSKLPSYPLLYLLLFIPIAILVFSVPIYMTRRKSKQLNRKLSEHLELLEFELRKEIREGFVELQMEKLDVVDSFGTIPFLDYKHFVLRTFFPKSEDSSSAFTEDTNESLSNPGHKDESITALNALICNEKFLITLIHTLEKQKTFSAKDRCLFASYLAIALQTNLVYLTHILEVLTKDLMEQSSNIQPKLMLRRTESVVEKLLTNWMSVCLSGFLRETVGEPFYLLVTTLNQRIIKGPVDVITCKALYTLNEDWLLWQVSEFNTVALNVVFEKILENEVEEITRNIQVNVLDCDTIGQAKEKILQAFLNKNGSLYGLQLSEMGLALQSNAQAKELLDIDSSSVILEDRTTKLNTIGHYEIADGATIEVFKKETDLLGEEYSANHRHLILPDSEAAKDIQGVKHKGKQKFKVKEMYLTKLLSTKEAPTNKLLYAKDIPQYKEEVKAFYKAIKDLPSLSTSELEEFLTQESKKHENEFNEAMALTKIYQYMARYYDEIRNKLEKERGLEEAQKQLLRVRYLADEKKKCKWN